ncbi:sugar efflux transporter [Gynuella sp.]|uniref:sugar efflux transporter n=1 Tax=Gynuella sp. TaxID=2969146 RepID=UPI003D112168
MLYKLLQQRNLLLLTTALSGLTFSFMMPLMSLFLVDELKAEPFVIGVYMIAMTASGLIISQWLGNLADRGFSTKTLFLLAMAAIALAAIIYANTHSFWVVLVTGTLLVGLGNSSSPQILTLSRQYIEQTGQDVTRFNTLVRASFSLAWIAGPPFSFSLVASLGFAAAFYAAALVAVINIIIGYKVLPDYRKPKAAQVKQTHPPLSLTFWLLGLVMGLGSISNSMYISAMPLHVLNELALPEYLPGVLMGMAAGLEIPFMLYSARLTAYINKNHLLVISFMAALLFYGGIYLATESWQLISLQVLNGLYFGVFAGLGLTMVQELMPERIGFASAFYTNCLRVGSMTGHASTGLIAQFMDFKSTALFAFSAILVAIVALIGFMIIQRSHRDTSATS